MVGLPEGSAGTAAVAKAEADITGVAEHTTAEVIGTAAAVVMDTGMDTGVVAAAEAGVTLTRML